MKPTATQGFLRASGPAQLLVSVRNVVEARAALAGGAGIIDVKAPDRGALGRADADDVLAIARAVASQPHPAPPVTVALGELTEADRLPTTDWPWPGPSTALITGAAFAVKLGLAHAPRDWRDRLTRAFAGLSPVRAVAVAYADASRVAAPTVDDVLDWALDQPADQPAAALLIDTAVKDGRGLRHWLNDPALTRVIEKAHEANLPVALAGSLRASDLPTLQALGADVLAVRGAACRDSDRTSDVNPAAVRSLADALREGPAPMPSPAG